MSKIFALLTACILFSCTTAQEHRAEIIEATQLSLLQSEGIKVIDIRTPFEYEKGHIEGAFHHNFLSLDFVKSLAPYKEEPLIIYCASGGRSQRASAQLLEAGFSKVYDYTGGFEDWKNRQDQNEL